MRVSIVLASTLQNIHSLKLMPHRFCMWLGWTRGISRKRRCTRVNSILGVTNMPWAEPCERVARPYMLRLT
jgi:hypothetical protein